MLCAIKNRDDLEKLEELTSIQNQVTNLGLKVKHGKQNFHAKIDKIVKTVYGYK